MFWEIGRSADERLRYQFVNCGTHLVLESIFGRYKKIGLLFPKLDEILSSNSMLTTSKVFQKSQVFESRRMFRRSQNFSVS